MNNKDLKEKTYTLYGEELSYPAADANTQAGTFDPIYDLIDRSYELRDKKVLYIEKDKVSGLFPLVNILLENRYEVIIRRDEFGHHSIVPIHEEYDNINILLQESEW